MSDVTRILEAIQHGDGRAADELLPLVYEELRRLAAHKMANEMPGQTLQPTALVHEAWLRLTGGANQEWNGRGHFFAAAAEAMRRILVENARRKLRLSGTSSDRGCGKSFRGTVRRTTLLTITVLSPYAFAARQISMTYSPQMVGSL